MGHRRGDAKAILLAVALLAVVQTAAAKDIIVGGSTQKWDFPPGTDLSYYDTWAAAQSFAIGDQLVFEYQAGGHDVQAVSPIDYESCVTGSNGTKLVTGYDIFLIGAGDYYFLCSFPTHCEFGMKVKVTVPPSAPGVAPAIAPDVAPPIAPALPPPLFVPSPSIKTPAPSPTARAPVSGTSRKSSAIGLIGGLVAGSVAVALVLGLLILRCRRKRVSCFGKLEPSKSSLQLPDATSRPFTYRELSSFTKNFSDSELLSSGGFGDVFKGTLPSGAFIAVKRIKRNKTQGEESFLAEATSLGQIRHRNLLRLRGWCQAKEGLLLVYDFMCNGSLDQWIYRTPSQGLNDEALQLEVQGLSWNMRLTILAGMASGLVYLHEEWQQCILHRDIKASNVLLDASFNAYLGDFGLACLVDHAVMRKTTLLAGTLGYMAPEMQYTGRASIETDVYAYGILVLEVVCGRRALDSVAIGDSTEHYVLVESVWEAYEAGHILRVADPRLWNGDDGYGYSGDGLDKTMVGKVLQLGLLCCLPSPRERPTMRFVNQWFQSGSGHELPGLPDSKPLFNWNAFRIDSSFAQAKRPAV